MVCVNPKFWNLDSARVVNQKFVVLVAQKKLNPPGANIKVIQTFIKSAASFFHMHQPSDCGFLPDSGILPGSEQRAVELYP